MQMVHLIKILIITFILSVNLFSDVITDKMRFKIVNKECVELRRFDKDSIHYDLLYCLSYIKNETNEYLLLKNNSANQNTETLFFKSKDFCEKYLKDKND